MRVSVVVPAYNEEAVIADAVRRLHDFWTAEASAADVEIVVVDDGSTDETAARVDDLGLPTVRLIRQANGGKGAAVRAGVLASSGDVVYFTDADLACSLDDQRRAVLLVEDGTLAVVGSRRLPGAQVDAYPLLRRTFSKSLSLLTRLLLGLRSTDTQCPLKCFRGALARQLFPTLRVSGFGFDLEVLTVLRRNGITPTEIPVHFSHTATTSVALVKDSLLILGNLVALRWSVVRGRYDGRLDPASQP